MSSIRVGLVGTGYAAKLRAETLTTDPRSHLVAVAGSDLQRTQAFSAPYEAEPMATWQALVQRPDVDLVIISTVNQQHGAIAQAALAAHKHVVVEYPLALEVAEARALVDLARRQARLLHVEHIELLSGIHLALRAALPDIGQPFYVRYDSINPQRPAPQKWTYQAEAFGFPLVGALSRLHRLIHLFGPVASVTAQLRTQPCPATPYYRTCLCSAQLHFTNGLIADVTYGKGESLWQAARSLTVHGENGAIVVDGETGTLILPDETRSLDLGSRRGLFANDTRQVLDHLLGGKPLYISPDESLYALTVADAARQSAELGQTIVL